MSKIKTGKIMQFEQSIAFYLRRGSARQSEGALLEAVVMYRKAAALEPNNAQVLMQLAQTYSDLGCFELSNRVLYSMLWRCSSVSSDFFYNVGCNYIGLREFDLALGYFERFASMADASSPQVHEVMSFLEIIESEGAGVLVNETAPDADAGAYLIANQGMKLIESGREKEALELLEKARTLSPRTPETLYAIATAHMMLGELDKARKVCNEALELDEFDVQGNCINVIVCHRLNDPAACEYSINIIKSAQDMSPEEEYKVAMTFASIGDEKTAQGYFVCALRIRPYDRNTLHAAAVNCMLLGEREKAAGYWSTILKIMGEDPIALYYLSLTKDAQYNPKGLNYHYQLPLDEELRLIQLINKAFKLPILKLRRDTVLLDIVRWAIEYGNEKLKPGALYVLTKCAPDKAEAILRDFIVRPRESREAKAAAFEQLNHIHAKEPYVSVEEEGIVEVRVGDVHEGILPQAYREVAQKIYIALTERKDEECLTQALAQWERYINGLNGKYNRIANSDNYAAAVEYIARSAIGKPLTQNEVCKFYGIPLSGIKNALSMLNRVLMRK